MARRLDFPELSGEQLVELQRILRSRSIPAGLYQRSYLIWNLAAGYPLKDAAEFANFHYTNAHKWMKRYLESGLNGLHDLPRSGRPSDYDENCRTFILKTATARPDDLGLSFQTWSLAKLEDYLRRQTGLSGLSRETIRRVLLSHGLRFQVGKTWCQSDDPDFEVKKTPL
jgi:transposase